MTTRDKILDAALTLFAKNGYNGTSVEQIAEIVGIKAPSLYKHFKGKEDILNALINATEARYEEFFGSEKKFGTIPDSYEAFLRLSLEKLSFTINDPVIRKVRVFLVQEQFRNERLAEITSRHQLDDVMKMFTKIIDGMMKLGLLRKNDSELLALELTAPVTVLVSKVDRQPEFKNAAMNLIEKHVCHFFDTYKCV